MMNNDRPCVRLNDVSIHFPVARHVARRQLDALHDISLEIPRGSKLGIVGRNGAGKSTLMRILAGVLIPDGGEIERNHGYVQLLSLGLGFTSRLTGRQNAVLSGLMMGLRRREIVGKLSEIHEFSELGEFFDYPIATYSTGMRARLAFSVAIQANPDLLLIDESLSVGDPAFKEKSKLAIRERLSSDTTVCLVAHEEQLIRSVCDQVVWLEKGRLAMCGSPDDVFAAYSSGSSRGNARD